MQLLPTSVVNKLWRNSKCLFRISGNEFKEKINSKLLYCCCFFQSPLYSKRNLPTRTQQQKESWQGQQRASNLLFGKGYPLSAARTDPCWVPNVQSKASFHSFCKIKKNILGLNWFFSGVFEEDSKSEKPEGIRPSRKSNAKKTAIHPRPHCQRAVRLVHLI